MKRIRAFVAVASAAILILLGMSIPAQAASSSAISSGDRQHVLDFFKQYSVPQTQWNTLISEWQAGKPWDSLTGAAPLSVSTQNTSGATVKVSRYADGSVMVSTLQKPTQVVTAGSVPAPNASLANCTVYTGSGYAVYRGCSVTNQWGNIYLGFAADYEVYPGTGQIDWWGSASSAAWGPGWSASQPYFDPVKTVSDGWGAAYARCHSTINDSYGSWDVWVELDVNGSGGWASNS